MVRLGFEPVGADKTTELWRPPSMILSVSIFGFWAMFRSTKWRILRIVFCPQQVKIFASV